VDKETVRAYSKYLIDEYERVIASNGRYVLNLKQFYNDGKISGEVAKNASLKSKIESLDYYRERLETIMKWYKCPTTLLTFAEFIESKK
jgi:hypothetical protein